MRGNCHKLKVEGHYKKLLLLCTRQQKVKDNDSLTRYPPADVREILRAETGFVCAIPSCNIPFLEFDHFDPEWKDQHHHDPDGMIALCPNHHRQARTNWTKEDLRGFKKNGKANAKKFEHKLEYLKRDLCCKIGGNIWHPDGNRILSIDYLPVLWFNRTSDNRKLLNLVIRDKNSKTRFRIDDNILSINNSVSDIVCTPNGKSFRIYFQDGSNFRMFFKQQKIHTHLPEDMIEIQMKLKDLNLDFQYNITKMKNGNAIGNSVASGYPGFMNFFSGTEMNYKELFKGHDREKFIYEEIDSGNPSILVDMFAYFLEGITPH